MAIKYILLAISIVLFALIAWVQAPQITDINIVLFGNKQNALFDLWSIQHLLSSVCVGFIILYFTRTIDLIVYTLLLLMIALGWELIELFAELGIFGNGLAVWFVGVEFWSNRLISDPFLVIVGGLLVFYQRKLIKPAVLIASIWLVINILSADSLAVQEAITFLRI